MTSTVYVSVIEDVINKVRDEFVNNGGPGESVLNELQGVNPSSDHRFFCVSILSFFNLWGAFLGLIRLLGRMG